MLCGGRARNFVNVIAHLNEVCLSWCKNRFEGRRVAIISLTSIPPRFDLMGPTLETLLAQRGIEAVELSLPYQYNRFPDWDGAIPALPAGVTVFRSRVDYGPATKILCAVQRYRGQDIQLLFCDDDRFYPPGWAAGLLAEAARHPDCAVALAGWDIADLTDRALFAAPRHQRRARNRDLIYRLARIRQTLQGKGRVSLAQKPARRIIAKSGFADILEGYGGVVVRPDFFDDQAFDVPEQAFHVDDIWLSGLLAKNRIGVWLAANQYEPKTTLADRQDALYRHRVAEKGRSELDADAIAFLRQKWGIWGGTASAP